MAEWFYIVKTVKRDNAGLIPGSPGTQVLPTILSEYVPLTELVAVYNKM